MKWVLLPGMDGTGLLFAPLLRALPAGIEPVVVPYPADRAAGADELLRNVLAHLPGEGEYALIAESFSGPLALGAAASHSHGPMVMVLCASFDRSPIPRWLLPISHFAARHTPRAIVRRLLLGNDAPAELAQILDRALDAMTPAALASRFAALACFDRNYAPASLPAPLLYLRASRDAVVGRAALHHLRRRYPQMRVETIDAPHLLLQSNPAAARDAITACCILPPCLTPSSMRGIGRS